MGYPREALRCPCADSLHRARGLPRAAYGAMLAHAGIGIAVIGIVATTAWQSEVVLSMKAGDRAEIAGYALTFRGAAPGQGPNYQEQIGLFTVTRGGAAVTELSPSKRTFTRRARPPRKPGSTSPGAATSTRSSATRSPAAASSCAYISTRWCASSGSVRSHGAGRRALPLRPPPQDRRPPPRPPPPVPAPTPAE